MSHKDAPPETPEQVRMREFYKARGVNVGWGRGKSGAYLAPFAADAWAAWQEAQRTSRLAEAEALIDELDAHEGAEGWSHDLKERLVRFCAARAANREDDSHE